MRSRLVAARTDGGFTLVEMMIVISMLGFIMAALAGTFMFMLKQTSDTQTRMEVSSDAQIATAYFADDMASVGVRVSDDFDAPLKQSVESPAESPTNLYPCGPASPSPVVRLAWEEIDVVTEDRTRVVVSYVAIANGGQYELHRYVCRSPVAVSQGPPTVTDQVVVHNVASKVGPPAPDVTVTCSTACNGSTPPASVTLTIKIQKPGSADRLTVALTGQRRQT